MSKRHQQPQKQPEVTVFKTLVVLALLVLVYLTAFPRYEYKVAVIERWWQPVLLPEDEARDANALGAKGWEIINARFLSGGASKGEYEVVLRRRRLW